MAVVMKAGCEGLCLNRPIRVAGAIEGGVDVKRDGVVNGDALEGGHGISGGRVCCIRRGRYVERRTLGWRHTRTRS